MGYVRTWQRPTAYGHAKFTPDFDTSVLSYKSIMQVLISDMARYSVNRMYICNQLWLPWEPLGL